MAIWFPSKDELQLHTAIYQELQVWNWYIVITKHTAEIYTKFMTISFHPIK